MKIKTIKRLRRLRKHRKWIVAEMRLLHNATPVQQELTKDEQAFWVN